MNFPPHFRSLHSSLFIAFHYLPSPFITFYRLSLPFIAFHYLSPPPHLIVRPLSAFPRFVLTSPHFVLTSPRSLTMPPHSPASHLLPSCFITPFVSHIRLSRTIVCAPFFYSLCFTHSIVLHRFALLSPIVYTPFALFTSSPFALFTPIVLHPFFYSPATSANPSPTPQKATFSHFSKKFCKKPLTKQKNCYTNSNDYC